MARSIKKGPYIDHNVAKKVATQNEGNKKTVIKTWSRRSMISPDYVTENMVGHKLGEFSPTRTFRGHSDKKK